MTLESDTHSTVSTNSPTTTAEQTRQPEARRPSTTRRALLAWTAVVGAFVAVAMLALVTFVGGDDGAPTHDGGYVGSDQHLVNMARDGEARTADGR
jgi:hypothetical protein